MPLSAPVYVDTTRPLARPATGLSNAREQSRRTQPESARELEHGAQVGPAASALVNADGGAIDFGLVGERLLGERGVHAGGAQVATEQRRRLGAGVRVGGRGRPGPPGRTPAPAAPR